MKRELTIYRQFIRFEERAAALYLKMASHFSEDRRLGDFWFEMGMEEKQHAGLLQFCVAEQLFSEGLPNAKEIRELNARFRILERRAANPSLTVDDAFGIAMELETSEVNAIYCHLTMPLHRSMYLLRRKIATLAPDHVSNLLAAARTFRVNEDQMRKLAGLIQALESRIVRLGNSKKRASV
jgi:hypothetical protein